MYAASLGRSRRGGRLGRRGGGSDLDNRIILLAVWAIDDLGWLGQSLGWRRRVVQRDRGNGVVVAGRGGVDGLPVSDRSVRHGVVHGKGRLARHRESLDRVPCVILGEVEAATEAVFFFLPANAECHVWTGGRRLTQQGRIGKYGCSWITR